MVLKRCFSHTYCRFCKISTKLLYKTHRNLSLIPLTSHFLSVPWCCFCCKLCRFLAKWCALAGWNKTLICVLWCAYLDFVCRIFNTRIAVFCKSYYKTHYTKHTLTSRFSLISTHALAVLYPQQQARDSILPTFSHTYCRFCKNFRKTLVQNKQSFITYFNTRIGVFVSTVTSTGLWLANFFAHVLSILQNFYKTLVQNTP